MSTPRNSTRYLRTAMVGIALVLPALSLIPLGSIWLWEHGYLLYWVGAALTVSIVSFLLEARLVGAPKTPAQVGASHAPLAQDASWTPREITAWNAVETLAAGVDPAEIASRDAIVDLGLRTIETVARNIHPQDPDPLWRFTVPEALALIERVSRELRPFVTDTIPLGDQLTVAQVLKVYRWRSAIGVAEKAYDLWRIIRLINPVAAITNEARERLTKKLYSGMRDEFAKRLTQGFVREVGRAAIDLYGGRLRVTAEDLAQHATPTNEPVRTTSETKEPLRILVLGRTGAGKPATIDALLRQLNGTRHMPQASPQASTGPDAQANKPDVLPPILFVDGPGITDNARALRALSAEAGASDLVMWVGVATDPDRRIGRAALDAIRAYFAERPDRRHPPILAVVTHIDPAALSSQAVRAVLDQVANDLAIPAESVVAVNLAKDHATGGIEMLWARISAALPDARHTQSVRRRHEASGWRWRKVLSQAVNTGRVAARAISKPKPGGK